MSEEKLDIEKYVLDIKESFEDLGINGAVEIPDYINSSEEFIEWVRQRIITK